jgi:hypothetical protein
MDYKLTGVSGYWIVKNKHDDKFIQWFHNSLKINCPYIFFGDKESLDIIKHYRGALPTYYIEYNIDNFYTSQYKNRMAIDPRHSPSAELNMIWNEKVFLIKRALEINPFNSEYFAWIDAGICEYRNKLPPTSPFPNINKLINLPTDKFIFTASVDTQFEPNKVGTYYHYIAGTSYIMHKAIINTFVEIYNEYIDKHLNIDGIYTDQIILTYIMKDKPEMFHKIGNGYGMIIPLLY